MRDEIDLGPRKKFAESLAQNLLKNAGVLSVPVSLSRIIVHLQGVRNLDVVGRSDFGPRVSGLLVICKETDGDYATIGFNEGHPWVRRRFTLAHEIGHLMLGHDGCNKEEKYKETEANVFAGELLIPTKALRDDFKKAPDIPTLAKRYLVSAQALSIKLQSARLL